MADAAELAALHGLCFPEGWNVPAFEGFLADPGYSLWVLRRAEAESVAGFLIARTAADEAEIITLAVAEDLRRQGFGRALLGQAAADLGRGPTTRIFLEVGSGNLAARRLYAACGFRLVGNRAGYYRESGEDALVLELRLGVADRGPGRRSGAATAAFEYGNKTKNSLE